MSQKPHKPRKKLKITLITIIVIILVLFIACGIYVSDYYHAEPSALQALESDAQVEVIQSENGLVTFEPQEQASVGLIFYPGGKVEMEAYAPLMHACAEQGIFCVLVEMPFNLAVFDMDAAEGIQEQYPQIEHWYIGGHSLGGAMAASYLGKHTDEYEGLVLLASYSTADLSETDLNVISLYGSQDQVLSLDKYEEYKGNLPQDFSETVIEGGCHAYFGDYGAQDGDGTPEISREEQIQITADTIAEQIIWP